MRMIFTCLLNMDFFKFFVLFILITISRAENENITEKSLKVLPGTVFFDLGMILKLTKYTVIQ